MANDNFSHLTQSDRIIIATGIERGALKTAIAETLGKEKSTICKEIKKNRIKVHPCSYPMECKNGGKCRLGLQCSVDCAGYIPFKCSRRDRSPGACNGCNKFKQCRYDKFKYDPNSAQKAYESALHGSRTGANLTPEEAARMADIVRPLLKLGHSPYQIIQDHPELGICEKSLYTYVETGVLPGVCAMDLRRQVSRKMPKTKANTYKKREDRKYLQGRKYDDYRAYIAENPNVHITQMDTVYNDVTNGPFVQTFKFLKCGLLFAVYHDEKTAKGMKDGVDTLWTILGPDVFRRYVHVLLTDRGTEFSDADGIEMADDQIRRTRVFYCDPMRSNQKGSLENKHIELRYIIPSGYDLRALGLTDQESLNRALSNVNSASLESCGGKSALEMTEFMYPDLYEKIFAYGVIPIPRDKVTLTPTALKA